MLRLRLWRLSEGLTQAEAARQLGMSHLTLGYLETGRLAPGPRDLDRLR
jgi:transcriptional regulator with XRE-family HTH domain